MSLPSFLQSLKYLALSKTSPSPDPWNRSRRTASAQPMRFRAILREAGRNIASGTGRTVPIALIFALCAGLLMGADWRQIVGVESSVRQWVGSGASTYAITAQGAISGSRCESLQSVNGVRAAGAFREAERLTFAALPSPGVPAYETTPHAANVLFASSSAAADAAIGSDDDSADSAASFSAGLILSRDVADALGARIDDEQMLQDGRSARIAGIYEYPDDGRQSGYGYAVLEPVAGVDIRTDDGSDSSHSAADDLYDTCLVYAWPAPDGIQSLLKLTLVGSGSETGSMASDDSRSSQIAQLNTTLGSTPPNASSFTDRVTAPLPWVMLGIWIIVGWFSVWMRRLELASAMHAGYAKPALAVQILLETSAGLLSGCMLASPVLVYALIRRPGSGTDGAGTVGAADDSMVILNALVRIPAAGCAGMMIGVVLGMLIVREQHLFIYFKSR